MIVDYTKLARAYAKAEEKEDMFVQCQANHEMDQVDGYYSGYMAEARTIADIISKNGETKLTSVNLSYAINTINGKSDPVEAQIIANKIIEYIGNT